MPSTSSMHALLLPLPQPLRLLYCLSFLAPASHCRLQHCCCCCFSRCGLQTTCTVCAACAAQPLRQ
jgi:hypothetical protein